MVSEIMTSDMRTNGASATLKRASLSKPPVIPTEGTAVTNADSTPVTNADSTVVVNAE